jgi:aminoglycoside/choline kinase family phosphotransferase
MDRVIQLYKDVFAAEPSGCVQLTGSASNRKYFRVSAEPYGCVGVIGTDVDENRAFIAIAEHFRSKGINVPAVLGVSQDYGTYIQQDLGDDILFNLYTKARRSGEGIEYVEELLCRTMAMLPKIQFEGADGLDFNICYPQPSFDRRMIMFDLNYFKYCFLKLSGLEFNEILLQDEFEKFADDLLEHDSDTFLYRDFNARNVMISEGVPYFIDFQGGRRGPIYYDVASFVFHSRADYPTELQQRMMECYFSELKKYTAVDKADFYRMTDMFRLLRILQTLGAYGFRGLVEKKADFVAAIPLTLSHLKTLSGNVTKKYPYMSEVLSRMAALPQFVARQAPDDVLEVKVTSFSFKKGVPSDPSGNGGGYVFDCRGMHNPGRYAPYKNLTGRDEPVIRFLEDDGEVFSFMEHVYGVVDPHVESFVSRGFNSLMVSFGCTGGQHRSVYCAEHLAAHLREKYPEINVVLKHREQNL